MSESKWWQSGVVYQVYPRSFQDSDGDGVGDLPGITSRLDHLVDLGVDAVWISPMFPSPMADFGYDISDYVGIEPMFGTHDDFDVLLAEARRRDLKVILDLVPCHTSIEHEWFRESRASRDSAKRAWYVWADPAPDGGPPNNWVSEFGGPAWTLDETTGQYYLHIYLWQQPALNWYHPEVEAAIHDVMRFWFDRGVDGFRIDAVRHLAPDDRLRDNPLNPNWTEAMGPARRLRAVHTAHQPRVFEAAVAMRRLTDTYDGDRVLIGEAYGAVRNVVRYYGEHLDGFQLPFNFGLLATDWTAPAIAALVDEYEAALPEGAWPNWVLGNHDRPRVASRVGEAQARVAAMLLLTLRGTPTIYQGEELGMTDVPIPPEMVQDPWEHNAPGLGLGRDPERTPMLWDDGPGAGFTTGEPWLPLGVRPGLDVASQSATPGSVLGLYRSLLALRRAHPALSIGDYRTISADDDVFVYERSHGDERFVVALNMSGEQRPRPVDGTVVLSTHGTGGSTTLGPDEGQVLRPA